MTGLSKCQEEQRIRILRYAMNEFTTKGIRHVKMDDVAAGLVMSKRTLYELFGDKENLLIEALRFRSQQVREEVIAITQKSANPLEAYVRIFNYKLDDLHTVNPVFLSEAQRYESVKKMFDEETERRSQYAMQFVNACREAGLFRSDVNYALMLRVFDITGHAIMKEELYREFGLTDIMHTVNITYIRGLCTPEGITVLDEALQRINKKKRSRKNN